MTRAEFEAARKAALDKIDRDIRDGIAVIEETKRVLEDLQLERRVTEATFDSIKPYVIG